MTDSGDNARGRELRHVPADWPIVWQWHSLTPFIDRHDLKPNTYLAGFTDEATATDYGARHGWPCPRLDKGDQTHGNDHGPGEEPV